MTFMTVEELRVWLRNWVVETTGVEPEEVTDTKPPLENFGLSSRDAVVLSGELENLLGTHLDATVAYEYPPTIAQLADRLINGPGGSRSRSGRKRPLVVTPHSPARLMSKTSRLSAWPAVSRAPTTLRSSGRCLPSTALARARFPWAAGANTRQTR